MKSKDAKLHRKIRQNWIKNLKKLNSLHQNAPVTSKSTHLSKPNPSKNPKIKNVLSKTTSATSITKNS